MSVYPEVTDAPSARRRETRARLLNAAIEIFAEEGLQGASVEAICQHAGYTRGAFYSNFESKEQLFLEMLERESSQRAADLAAKAAEIEPELRGTDTCLSPEEAARYVAEFLAPSHDQSTWFVLEVEFLMLAIRDPSIAPGHHEFMDRFYASISGQVEQVIRAAGRRFTIPIERALPALNSAYERALRNSALGGPEQGNAFDDLGERIAELLFALTEPLQDKESAGQAGDGATTEAPSQSRSQTTRSPSSAM